MWRIACLGLLVGVADAHADVRGVHLRSYGVGVYPLNLQTQFSRDVVGYVSVGGTAS